MIIRWSNSMPTSAVCYNVLQCVAVCVAVCCAYSLEGIVYISNKILCNTLQHTATHPGMIFFDLARNIIPKCVAAHCIVLQCVVQSLV